MTVTAVNGLPALPGDIGPNEPVVTFVMHECRTCGERSDWFRQPTGADIAEPAYEWQFDHRKMAADHHSFYVYEVTRRTSRTFYMT